jgi:hypothetical protein
MHEVIPVLLQLPFVAAFIWFALRMSNEYREDSNTRDKHWMEFLTLERQRQEKSLKMLGDHVLRLDEAMKQFTEKMSVHDAGALERFKCLQKRFEDTLGNAPK